MSEDVRAAPLERTDLARWKAARAAGASPSDALDELLRGLSDTGRARLGRLLKESGGAWCALHARDVGSVLLAGNALSGTAVALAMRARLLVLCDVSLERLAIARARLLRLGARAKVLAVAGAAAGSLPFADASFALALHESAPAGEDEARELARVARDEVALVVRSDLRAALERSGFGVARRFELLPSREDAAQVVAADASAPARFVGPSRWRALRARIERRLRPSAGSEAWIVARRGAPPARAPIEAALAELAERLGEPEPVAEHVLASCGDSCEVYTAPRARRGDGGRWRVHVALRPDHVPGLERAHRMLARLRADRRPLPLPEPLFAGAVAGLWLTCERRAPGFAADLLSRRLALADRIAAQAAEHLAALRVRERAPLSEGEFARDVDPLFERALAMTGDAAARAALEELRRRARSRLCGMELPRVLVHGDLRAKHVQASRGGRVHAYVHWGVASEAGLPCLDLVHLLVHARVRSLGQGVGRAWRALLRPDELRPGERRAFEGYGERLGLPRAAAPAIALVYPAFVATVGFQHASSAPPDWLARQFELGAAALG